MGAVSGHNTGAVLEGRITRRGTSNGNDRGNSKARRARREWLIETYAADVDVLRVTRYWTAGYNADDVDVFLRPLQPGEDGLVLDALRQAYLEEWRDDHHLVAPTLTEHLAACRCYRCGTLLTVDSVTVDRIVPGCKGGTYRRSNIRPACGHCNSETGGHLGAERRAS